MILLLTPVEEHVADDSRTAVNLEGVSAQHDPLQHHTLRVTAQKAASGHQVLHSWSKESQRTISSLQTHLTVKHDHEVSFTVGPLFEEQDSGGREGDWGINGHDRRSIST